MPGIEAIVKRHVSTVTSYRDERIDCSCGAVITAESDPVRRDRHEPLIMGPEQPGWHGWRSDRYAPKPLDFHPVRAQYPF